MSLLHVSIGVSTACQYWNTSATCTCTCMYLSTVVFGRETERGREGGRDREQDRQRESCKEDKRRYIL